MNPADPVDRLATNLISHGSRFARTASRGAGSRRSLVALRVLANLQHDGPLRIGELALRESISQPAMTTTVNRLENDGLVTRRADPEDARAASVALTASGDAELEAFRARAAEHVRGVLNELGADDIAVLRRAADLLDILADRLAET